MINCSNSNRTEWSPIPAVCNRTSDNKNWTTVQRESDLFIKSMITDRIGHHEVLLPINHKSYNFREKKNSQVMKELPCEEAHLLFRSRARAVEPQPRSSRRFRPFPRKGKICIKRLTKEG